MMISVAELITFNLGVDYFMHSYKQNYLCNNESLKLFFSFYINIMHERKFKIIQEMRVILKTSCVP